MIAINKFKLIYEGAMGASQFEGLLKDGSGEQSVFWTARSGPWHVFLNPRKFVVFAVRHQGPIGNPRCIPGIRPVYNRDDFYDPGPLTSSPTPIPSGVLCGDNSSLSYIVARRCRACAVCARLSCRIPLRSGLRTRCGFFCFVILDRIAE